MGAKTRSHSQDDSLSGGPKMAEAGHINEGPSGTNGHLRLQ